MPRPSILLALLAIAGSFTSPAIAQTMTTRVVFVAENLNRTSDQAIQAYLEGRYGKANVTFLSTEPAGNVQASSILGYDVAVLSSTPSSGRYRGILDTSTTPIVNMEEAMARNLNGEFKITDGRTKETELAAHVVTIGVAHPITKGFTVNQNVTLTTAPAEVWWSTGAQAPGATSLAADDDTATNLFITIVDAGGTLLDNSKAPCRRVMFGMTDFTFDYFTADAQKLFGQAVDWAAASCCAQTHNYGVGLTGTNGIPTLTTSAAPVFKSTINVLGSNSSGASATALLLIGNQQISVPFLGGTLLVNPTLQVFVTLPANGMVIPVTIPDLSPLCGVAPFALRFQVQLLQLDSAAVGGVAMTPGMQLRTGH